MRFFMLFFLQPTPKLSRPPERGLVCATMSDSECTKQAPRRWVGFERIVSWERGHPSLLCLNGGKAFTITQTMDGCHNWWTKLNFDANTLTNDWEPRPRKLSLATEARNYPASSWAYILARPTGMPRAFWRTRIILFFTGQNEANLVWWLATRLVKLLLFFTSLAECNFFFRCADIWS